MRTTKALLGVLAAVAAAPMAATAGDISPWTPLVGVTEVNFSVSRQEATELFAGETQAPLPTELSQDTFSVVISRSVTDRVAIDLEIGYAKSDFLTDPGLAPKGGLDGLTDIILGVRFKALDEADGAPLTLTLGGAAIIEGGYDTGALPAIGDGGSGLQLAAALGRQFGRFSLSGDLGFRSRGNDVPDEWFGAINGSVAVTSRVAVYGSVSTVDSSGDLDIGGPGFSPARFPEVEEDYSLWVIGVAAGVAERARVSFTYGEKFDGRNTAKSDLWHLQLGYTF